MRTIVITGAGSGIGRASAQVLSEEENTRLLLIGRRKEQLEETRKSLHRADQHMITALDVRSSEAWIEALKNLDAPSLNISGVFANAGTGGENHFGKDDRWDEIISVNLNGTYQTIMHLLPYMRKSGAGFKHIVITSSCLARFGVPHYTAYCTAKTGLLGLTRSLAVELAAEKFLVNAICPGWVETEMAKAGISLLADRSGKNYDDEFRDQMSYVPLNRISQPEEIGRFVRFLLSGEQTSITGQALDINNGSFMI